MLQDLKNEIFPISCIVPGTKGATTVNGVAVSLEKYIGIVFVLYVGAKPGTVTPVIEESADGSTGWTAIETERLNPATALAAVAANSITQYGITDINKLTKNFVRMNVVVGAGGADLAVMAIMGHAVDAPAGEVGANSIYIA